jgi:hypothetical protein
MNIETMRKLIAILPDSEKKAELMAKLQAVSGQPSGSKGLHDEFSLSPKGAIKIEAINDLGEVTGTLLEQSNLVVAGSEEILLRAFSGDTDRLLYKNRYPKSASVGKFYVPSQGLTSLLETVNGDLQLVFPVNEYWKGADDTQFSVSYGYRPRTVYLKEEVSDMPGMLAFSVQQAFTAGSVPISAEVYSSHTNMFIGIGDGKRYVVPFNDERLTISEGWTDTAEGKKKATATGESISFKQKISNFKVRFEASKTSGQIEVKINGVVKEVIDGYDAGAAATYVTSKEYVGLDQTVETEVTLTYTGNNAGIAAGGNVVIEAIEFDALAVSMSSLLHEFDVFTNTFDTPTYYNTTTVAPFYTKVKHYPVDPTTVEVTYNNQKFTRVMDKSQLSDSTFFVDQVHGFIYFNRALTRLMITYKTTGDILESDLTSNYPKASVASGTNNAVAYKTKFAIKGGSVTVTNGETGTVLTLAASDADFGNGKYLLDPLDPKKIILPLNGASGNPLKRVEVVYKSDERPGFPTGYNRKVIEKPKTGISYPWYSLDTGTVNFVVEFPEGMLNDDVTIREMALYDGPHPEDNILGYNNYPVKTFSLIRVGEIRKEVNTGLRITWSITLLNKDGQPFKGGF